MLFSVIFAYNSIDFYTNIWYTMVVAREQVLRDEIAKIIAEIEV